LQTVLQDIYFISSSTLTRRFNMWISCTFNGEDMESLIVSIKKNFWHIANDARCHNADEWYKGFKFID